MFNLIPAESYTSLFYYFTLVLVIITWGKLTQTNRFSKSSQLDLLLVLGLILYIGLRPISGFYFGDMATYANGYRQFQAGNSITNTKDLGFQYFMLISSKLISIDVFFLICATLYVSPLYLVSKKWFGDYWYYAFLMLIASFSFWTYGTNGIRNGIAGSLFLLAISRERKIFKILFLLLAIGFHKSMLLPTFGLILSIFYNQPKKMIAFWILCIPLSLIAGGFWENLFNSLGFDDDRMSYLNVDDSTKVGFSSIGFRWDFLLYSAIAVFSGWYFIVKEKFEDKLYFTLFNTYIFCNAFWILVIRANFSNRFAYLSWFMMALVIIYPFLKVRLLKNQPKKLGTVILLYFLFTFLLNIIFAL